jgi:cyclic-di-GMP phosphodiesterase, flagellum assembly factor TipF
VQALVYIFIALAALAAAATAYYGLAFTPAEAILAGLVFLCVAVIVLERILRRRAELRLERAIEDLSRLLSTVAQAGAVLGQRINVIADINAGNRLEGAEADISVLGTVIRQVAEAVADIEERGGEPHTERRPQFASAEPEPVIDVEPIIPLDAVRQAIAESRLVYHVEPIVTLPQRRPHGYDLVPRLMLEDGDLADRADFLPLHEGEDVKRQIEAMALAEAIAIARRARSSGHPTNLFVPLSRATLGDTIAFEQLIVSLEASRAVAGSLVFLVPDSDWRFLTSEERDNAKAVHSHGASFSLSGVRSLRADIAELAEQGVRTLRVDAARFLRNPEALTDFHASDIADYLSRSGIGLVATGIANEGQILELLDDGITLVQGAHIGGPGPIRPDLMVEPARQLAQAGA